MIDRLALKFTTLVFGLSDPHFSFLPAFLRIILAHSLTLFCKPPTNQFRSPKSHMFRTAHLFSTMVSFLISLKKPPDEKQPKREKVCIVG